MPESDFDRLQIPNGIRLDEDSMMEIEIAFDGERITYRGEDGTLQEMGTLCYLDYILRLFIGQMTDEHGNDIHPQGITPGHVLCHLIQHLHSQWHEVDVRNQMAALGEMFGNQDSDNPLAGAFVLGPDGLEAADLADLPERIAKALSQVTDATTETDEPVEAADGGEGLDIKVEDKPDDDEGEIIVHGVLNDPYRK